jgi:hypothetical protein
MASYESVLSDARSLSPAERELLFVEIGLTLDDGGARPSQSEFLRELEAISRDADEDPGSLSEWEDAEREIFQPPPRF